MLNTPNFWQFWKTKLVPIKYLNKGTCKFASTSLESFGFLEFVHVVYAIEQLRV